MQRRSQSVLSERDISAGGERNKRIFLTVSRDRAVSSDNSDWETAFPNNPCQSCVWNVGELHFGAPRRAEVLEGAGGGQNW
jgi:hypothetical protein